jgi:hypothetical protein
VLGETCLSFILIVHVSHGKLNYIEERVDAAQQARICLWAHMGDLWQMDGDLDEGVAEEEHGLKGLDQRQSQAEGVFSMFTPNGLRLSQEFVASLAQGDILKHQTHEPPPQLTLALTIVFIEYGQPMLFAMTDDLFAGLGEGLFSPDTFKAGDRSQTPPFLGEALDVRYAEPPMTAWREHHRDFTCIYPATQGGRVNAKPLGGFLDANP